jgi:hypothetical protein
MSNEWEKPDTYEGVGKTLAVLITAIAALRKTMRKLKPIAQGKEKEKCVTREHLDQYAEHQNRLADETFKGLENLYGLV